MSSFSTIQQLSLRQHDEIAPVSSNSPCSTLRQARLEWEHGAVLQTRSMVLDGAVCDKNRASAGHRACRCIWLEEARMKRAMVVDDDPQVLSLTARCLQDAGYETVLSSDFREARLQMQVCEPSVVVADIRL